MSADTGVLSDHEGNANYKPGYEPPFSYDTGSKNTVSSGNVKERTIYNPSNYTGNDLYK